MTIDHSETYKETRFRNLPHLLRKKRLLKLAETAPKNTQRYIDFGCSNGYLTNLISKIVASEKTLGFDHSNNIEIAKKLYSNIWFGYVNLNKVSHIGEKADVVSCFETLEHVGDTLSAIKTLRNACSDSSVVLISVPIEIGFVGLLKYVIKRFMYRYPLELSCGDLEYLTALITGRYIGRYRNAADGYGSHFGFDYRTIDAQLEQVFLGFTIDRWNSSATRFYRIAKF